MYFQSQVECIPVQGEMYFRGEFENAGRSSSVSLGVRGCAAGFGNVKWESSRERREARATLLFRGGPRIQPEKNKIQKILLL